MFFNQMLILAHLGNIFHAKKTLLSLMKWMRIEEEASTGNASNGKDDLRASKSIKIFNTPFPLCVCNIGRHGGCGFRFEVFVSFFPFRLHS